MGSASTFPSKLANPAPASSCNGNEGGLQTNFSVMQAVRNFCSLKSKKPLDEIRAATRASDRMIQYWLSNKYSISADALADLLRTDAGFAILENIIGEARPAWWRDFRRSVKRAEVRRQQALLQKEIDRIDQGELEV